jgi:transcriptional regulator with GAF, ATPase, and Fis domain
VANGQRQTGHTERIEILVTGPGAQLREWVETALEGVPRRILEEARLPGEGQAIEADEPDPDLALVEEEEAPDFVERLTRFKTRFPRCQVLLLGLHDSNLNPRRLGAAAVRHWFFRPVEREAVLATLRAAGRSLSKSHREQERRSRERLTLEAFVGRSPGLLETLELARRVAQSPTTPVLIFGETGTGKGLLARVIHGESPIGDGPFVELNCAAIPHDLVESELFGHTRGAFTSATRDKPGLLELADGGTAFLDEIGDLALAPQGKLLKFLDGGVLRRLAATTTIQVRARIIAATNRDLENEVKEGRFRLDLYHRLGVVVLRVPPLRERREDIPLLAERYLEHYSRECHGRKLSWGRDALEVLSAYDWPGNVRELINLTERLVLLAPGSGPITAADLPSGFARRPQLVRFDLETQAVEIELPPGGVSFDEVERAVLRAALRQARGNVTRAAALLGMGRGGLRYRLDRLQVTEGVSRRRGRPMGRRRPRAA